MEWKWRQPLRKPDEHVDGTELLARGIDRAVNEIGAAIDIPYYCPACGHRVKTYVYLDGWAGSCTGCYWRC